MFIGTPTQRRPLPPSPVTMCVELAEDVEDDENGGR